MIPETSQEDRSAASSAEHAPRSEDDDGGAAGGEPLDERTRIVRMVAAGRLSVDQAVELLRALEPEAVVDGGRGGSDGHDERAGRNRVGWPGAEAAPAPARAVPQPAAPPRLPSSLIGRVLRFEVQDDDKLVTASLPLGLVGREGRFLPRAVRQALEESDVDLDQIRDLIVNGGADLENDCTLLEISDDGDDKRLTINLS